MSVESQINFENTRNKSEVILAARDLVNTIEGLLAPMNVGTDGYKSAFVANASIKAIYRVGDDLESPPGDDSGYYHITGIQFDDYGKPTEGIRGFKLPKKISSISENDIKKISDLNIAAVTLTLTEGQVIDGEDTYIKALNYLNRREALIRNIRAHSNDFQ